jgi:hypothetical protein
VPTAADQQPTTAREIGSQLPKSIDTASILPQYLGLDDRSLPRVGLHFSFAGPNQQLLQGKIVHGGTFMATKKKAKKKKH